MFYCRILIATKILSCLCFKRLLRWLLWRKMLKVCRNWFKVILQSLLLPPFWYYCLHRISLISFNFLKNLGCFCLNICTQWSWSIKLTSLPSKESSNWSFKQTFWSNTWILSWRLISHFHFETSETNSIFVDKNLLQCITVRILAVLTWLSGKYLLSLVCWICWFMLISTHWTARFYNFTF